MFSARWELWSDSSSHVEGWLYDAIILALLRDCTSESTDPRPHFQALQYHFCAWVLFATLLFLFIQIIKNTFLPSILHFYHHLFAELVHLYNLHCIGCVGDRRDFLYLVARSFERLSSSYASHRLINLRSST